MKTNKKFKGNRYLLLLVIFLVSVATFKYFQPHSFNLNRAKKSFVKTVENYNFTKINFERSINREEAKKNKYIENLLNLVVNTEAPPFITKIMPVPQNIKEQMINVTWHEKCPITLDQLVLLEVSYWNNEGNIIQGELIVNKDVAEPLSIVFKELFHIKFPINKMRPAYEFNGDDLKSMRVNNTSSFNCRAVENTDTWSQHAYGRAIDINPLVNPYIKNGTILPPEGQDYINRERNVPGMIYANSLVVKAFERIGWKWGGNWNSLKDYQHFSRNGF